MDETSAEQLVKLKQMKKLIEPTEDMQKEKMKKWTTMMTRWMWKKLLLKGGHELQSGGGI